MSYLHHNPFTQKIEEIQKQWIEVRTNNPDTKLFCYQCFDQDFKYLLKTIQIETTEHMVYPEFMFEFEEDFTNEKEFYFKIIFQIILMLNHAYYQKEIVWDDFVILRTKRENHHLKGNFKTIIKCVYLNS